MNEGCQTPVRDTRGTNDCPDWCVDHYRGDHPDDSFCRTETVSFCGYESYLSNGTLDDAPLIFVRMDVHGDGEGEFTARQARAFAARLMTLAGILERA